MKAILLLLPLSTALLAQSADPKTAAKIDELKSKITILEEQKRDAEASGHSFTAQDREKKISESRNELAQIQAQIEESEHERIQAESVASIKAKYPELEDKNSQFRLTLLARLKLLESNPEITQNPNWIALQADAVARQLSKEGNPPQTTDAATKIELSALAERFNNLAKAEELRRREESIRLSEQRNRMEQERLAQLRNQHRQEMIQAAKRQAQAKRQQEEAEYRQEMEMAERSQRLAELQQAEQERRLQIARDQYANDLLNMQSQIEKQERNNRIRLNQIENDNQRVLDELREQRHKEEAAKQGIIIR